MEDVEYSVAAFCCAFSCEMVQKTQEYEII